MKTLFKRPFAVFLAVLIVFSSLTAAISAADYPTGKASCDAVWSVLEEGKDDKDENYVVSNLAVPGQKVKVDFYFTTDFTAKTFAFLYGYNANMLELDTSKSAATGDYFVNISPAGLGGKYKDGSNNVNGLIKNGIKTAEDFKDVGTVLETANFSNTQFNNTKALTFYFTVLTNVAADAESTFAPVPGTIKSVKYGEDAAYMTGNVSLLDEDGSTWWSAEDYELDFTSDSEVLKIAQGTVKYDAGAGSIATSDTITKDNEGTTYTGKGIAGKAVEIPEVTPPTNKAFDGWSKTADGTKLSSEELAAVAYKTSNPETLYALYTDIPATYKLTVKTMKADGTTYEIASSEKNSAVGAEIKASDYDYDKDKYTLNAAASNDIVVSADDVKECVVVLDRTKFDITWKVNNEQVGEKASYVWGADLSGVSNPSYVVPEGYTLSWSEIPSVMPAANQEITGTLSGKPVTITLNPGDGKLDDATVDGTFDGTATLPDPTPAEEKTFIGWEYTDKDGNKQTVKGTSPKLNLDNVKLIPDPTGDGYTVEFIAKYSTAQYTIIIVNTYNDPEEVVDVLTGDYGTETGKKLADYPYSSTPEKTFDGWDAAEIPATYGKYSGTYSAADVDYTNCLVIKNKWISNSKVTVTYNYNGEEGYTNQTLTDYPGSSITVPELPSKSGYDYSWENNLTEFPANDVTVNLVKTAKKTEVTFDPDNGSDPETVETSYDSPVRKPADPEKEGQTFLGWEDEDGNAFDFSKPLEELGDYEEKITLKAVYGYVDTYYVPAVEGTSVVYTPQLVVKGETGYDYSAQIPDPSKTGFEFLGWFDGEGDDANKVDPTGIIGTANANFYAHLKAKPHTVTYNNYDGSLVEKFDTNFGAVEIPVTATVPEKPADGATTYTFIGWKDASGKAPQDYETMPDADLVFTAQFQEKVNENTVDYYVDGKLYKSFPNVKAGDPVPTPDSDPKKFGKKFAGWTPEIPSEMPDGALRFDATWEDNSSVAPVVIGGVVVAGAVIGTVAAINTAVITSLAVVGGTVAVIGAVHVAKHTFKVTYVVNGEKYRTYYVIEGTKIPVPKDPSVEGSKFAGWSPEVPSKMPAQDQTFTAVFVDGSIPDTGSTSTAFATLAIVSSATLAAYVIRKKKDEED